jgi:hypothetical protein
MSASTGCGQRLIDGSSDNLAGTACRVIRLKMSEPRYRDDEDEIEIDKIVDVTGRIVEIEIPY